MTRTGSDGGQGCSTNLLRDTTAGRLSVVLTCLAHWFAGSPRAVAGANHRARVEPLEQRHMLSVVPVVGLENLVGQQPTGALSGKIVYTSAGHGWTADNLGNGAWQTQRGNLYDMVEDLGNQDQMTMYVDYLFNAGATVVPMRPVGHQPNEVVLDNDSPGVEYFGTWQDSTHGVYFGDPGDVPYRYATTYSTQTAYARYRPTIPESGHYPVYTWVLASGNRASDQLYRIHYAGGINEVTVNHRMVGGGYVYLGTYYFEAGSSGYVDISNQSADAGKVVIADAIRFGNGMGDLDRGGGPSGKSREDEAALYWIMAQVGQGTPESEYRESTKDRTATVCAPPFWAEHMNREAEGATTDRVYLGFHTNAYNGEARGVSGLYNLGDDYNTPTANQTAWATIVAQELQDDMLAVGSPPLEHAWRELSRVIYGASFGEIDNNVIQDEFDATIIEVAFHDNEQDAQLMRDAKARDWAGQSCYHGTVEYFDTFGTVATTTLSPDPVTNVRATVSGENEVTIEWTPPGTSAVDSGAPTGYRVMISENGFGFNTGTYVAGASATSLTFSDFDPADGVRYFRVVAVNTGGQSRPSEVVAARPGDSGAKSVLIVNGFDRLDRHQNPKQAYHDELTDRVRPTQSNSFDYAVRTAEAIEDYATRLRIDTTANECVIDGSVELDDYDAVIWILGEESVADKPFDATEQGLVSSYLAGGGDLFVSGSELGYALFARGQGITFIRDTLHVDYLSDDAGTYGAGGASGGIFEGLSFEFDNGQQLYDVDYPDVIRPRGSAVSVLEYNHASRHCAAVAYENAGTGEHLIMMAFPFETITTEANRTSLMTRALDFFHLDVTAPPGDANHDGSVDHDDAAIVAANWGADDPNVTWEMGDFNDDDRVDLADASIMAANWGDHTESSTPTDGAAAANTAFIGPQQTASRAPRRLLQPAPARSIVDTDTAESSESDDTQTPDQIERRRLHLAWSERLTRSNTVLRRRLLRDAHDVAITEMLLDD